MAITFEGYERRIDKINKALASYGIKDLEEARQICVDKGIDVESIVKGVQPIAFENAVWAYTVGSAIAIKKNCSVASAAAEAIGEGLQCFCIPGSVADQRKVGLGHHARAYVQRVHRVAYERQRRRRQSVERILFHCYIIPVSRK